MWDLEQKSSDIKKKIILVIKKCVTTAGYQGCDTTSYQYLEIILTPPLCSSHPLFTISQCQVKEYFSQVGLSGPWFRRACRDRRMPVQGWEHWEETKPIFVTVLQTEDRCAQCSVAF